MPRTTVKATTDYDKFKFIKANREQSRGHVEMLKQAFEVMGNLTKVQPILVNEKFQIVDGQHRFTAAKELDQPIYFTVHSGLGIAEARGMNILHRGWETIDYARSYASSGDKNYQEYLRLKEDYGFSHSVLLAYINNTPDKSGVFREFREGGLVIDDLDAIQERLERLAEAIDKTPTVSRKSLSVALLKIMQSEEYDHSVMLKRLEKYGYRLVKVDALEENLRQLEELYNHNTSLAHRVRLY